MKTEKMTAGEDISYGSAVKLVKNPKWHWWTFWRSKMVVVPILPSHVNCRCVFNFVFEDEPK